MDKLIIRGGVPLNGEVSVSGAKNAVLPMLCASVMASDKHVILKNIPHLHDVTTTVRLLRQMGVSVTLDDNMNIQLDPSTIKNYYAPYDLVKTMRSSILVLGPLLSRFGSAKVSLPGGCAIGTRPVEMHLDALTQMGASIGIDNGYITASCKKLIGAEIRFSKTTVTGTENILMASTLAEGKTIISNAAREPEVVDLANFLNKMGASITGHGTDIIEVTGVEKLRGVSYSALPDRIETGTFLVAAAITGGCVTVKNTISSHVSTIIEKLKLSGADITLTDTSITLDMKGKRPLAVDIETGAYPLFPTDMQAQLTALNTVAKGKSIIKENIFENRFMHVQEMTRMGADIRVENNCAKISGSEKLIGASVMATDLRASASLILVGLVATGITEIERIYHIDRGYDCIEEKLQQLGANISRVPV
ncbi:MAG: UDP-N-acetylglucosamine 1-carboxyvinyltransferase [Gammaproteobacteria bacterium]|mgnify:CR=1 FL=1|nr:UDP-N-acetylglucosamine 1-carboxyvinyltransferase [Gammaproteobacteria bacterium]MBT5116362.1 UDP-N-acetylglucosamine 1-carboxyvinyltransferase [Gammaproteobacteria bacterium]